MSAPRVSAIVPVFNAERFLGETVQSVLAQTLGDWELLLVDDGSADGSVAIAKEFAARHPDVVRYVEHPGHANRGQFETWILGAGHARADLIALLDADDVWEPTYLETHLRHWDALRLPNVQLSYGPAVYWFPDDPTGARNYVQPMPPGAPAVYRPPELLEPFFAARYANTPCPSCALLRREVFDQVKDVGRTARDSFFSDQTVWWYVAARWPVAAHSDALVRYRQHQASVVRATSLRRARQAELAFLRVARDDLSTACPRHPLLTSGKLAARIEELAANDTLAARTRETLSRRLPPSAFAMLSGAYRATKSSVRSVSANGRRLIPKAVKRPVRRTLDLVELGRSRMRLGRGVRPLSYQWGGDRGLPIHRYYLNRFLREFASDIRGHCLEFQEDSYSTKYGGPAVTRLDILHVDESNPAATIVADLTRPNDIPSDRFDCIICTHVLHVIGDLDKAVAELCRILKPGGVLLVAVPHVSMCDPDYHELWRFTPEGLSALLARAFGPHVLVRPYGNSLTAAGEIRGFVAGEFTESELDHHDPRVPVEVCARAGKPAAPESAS